MNMEKSNEINELAKALVAFQSKIKGVKKDGVNPFFKSKYATLESIIDSSKDLLAENGLSFSQFPSGSDELTTVLMHVSGQFLMSTAKIKPKDDSPQGQGSAITYMRRYALSAVLGIATETDDDGEAATHPVAPRVYPTAPAGGNKDVTIKNPEAPASPAQIKMLCGLANQLGHKDAEGFLKDKLKIQSFSDLNKGYASKCITRLKELVGKMEDGVPAIQVGEGQGEELGL